MVWLVSAFSLCSVSRVVCQVLLVSAVSGVSVDSLALAAVLASAVGLALAVAMASVAEVWQIAVAFLLAAVEVSSD